MPLPPSPQVNTTLNQGCEHNFLSLVLDFNISAENRSSGTEVRRNVPRILISNFALVHLSPLTKLCILLHRIIYLCCKHVKYNTFLHQLHFRSCSLVQFEEYFSAIVWQGGTASDYRAKQGYPGLKSQFITAIKTFSYLMLPLEKSYRQWCSLMYTIYFFQCLINTIIRQLVEHVNPIMVQDQ